MIDREQIRNEFPFMKEVALEHDSGWNELVYRLCEKIDSILKKNPELLEEFMVTQVKEKYGGLRFYIYGGNDKIYEAIDKYEDLSYNTCEVCGQPGTTRDYGWLKTLCDEHYAEILKERKY